MDRIIALRNRAAHGDLHITPDDADTMRRMCYDVINLLHPPGGTS